MRTELKHFLYGLLFGGILALFLCMVVVRAYKNQNKPISEPQTVQTDTLSTFDSMAFVGPEIKQETPIVTITVPVYVTDSTAIAERDSLLRLNGILLKRSDSLTLELTKVQRYYEKDSVYQAWVSGVNPVLDSIKVFTRTNTVTNTTEVPKPYKYKPKFTFGLQGGGGVVFPVNQTPTAGLYIGIGAQYNF